jgi:CBS domain-containing protein
MIVDQVMTRAVRTVTADVKVIEVSSIMCLYRHSGLPVVEGDNKLIGYIAEKDILHYLFPTLEDLMGGSIATIDFDDMMGKYKDLVHMKTSELMSSNPITVSPDMHVLKASAVMVRHRFRRIPVAENGRLVGMLSLGDVHKAIFQANIGKLAR